MSALPQYSDIAGLVFERPIAMEPLLYCQRFRGHDRDLSAKQPAGYQLQLFGRGWRIAEANNVGTIAVSLFGARSSDNFLGQLPQ